MIDKFYENVGFGIVVAGDLCKELILTAGVK